ncbi:MAG: hypothetical protein KIG14_01465, partial [Candidatus Sacchiramonaceae bacterium]|nr:hypothetical protein [Candidatus Saccharimonadaceae bacterium]
NISMSKKTKIISIFVTGAFLGVASSLISPAVTSAAEVGGIKDGIEASRSAEMPVDLFGASGIFTQVTNVLLFLIGVLSVIMLIFGGLRYIISGGNAKSVESAKNTILYAIVGLVVAILAFAIVNFVVGTFVPSGAGGSNYSAPAQNSGGDRQPTDV